MHHFPVIRDALLTVYQQRYNKSTVYIRVAGNGYFNDLYSLKMFIITASGAMRLKKRLQQRQIPHNTSFAGIYNFNNAKNYAALFPDFLARINDGGIIMCHPGLASNNPNDQLVQSRYHEWKYLMSDRFKQICCQQHIALTAIPK